MENRRYCSPISTKIFSKKKNSKTRLHLVRHFTKNIAYMFTVAIFLKNLIPFYYLSPLLFDSLSLLWWPTHSFSPLLLGPRGHWLRKLTTRLKGRWWHGEVNEVRGANLAVGGVLGVVGCTAELGTCMGLGCDGIAFGFSVAMGLGVRVWICLRYLFIYFYCCYWCCCMCVKYNIILTRWIVK